MSRVKMTPVAIKGRSLVYSPHPFKSEMSIDEAWLEGLEKHPMLVSFEPDGSSEPRCRQAYFFRAGWYIIGGWVKNVEAGCQKQFNHLGGPDGNV